MRDLRGEPITKEQYEEQLRKWADGESVHLGDNKSGSCCPDFSCCQPSLLAAPEIRRAFVQASDENRMSFLGAFLGAAIQLAASRGEFGGKEIHIVKDDPTEAS